MMKRSYSVVIAEDILIQRRLIYEYSKKVGLHVIGETGSGHLLIKIANDLKPDIILLDITLHKYNGIDALREIYAGGVTPEVIFTTGSGDPDHLLAGINEFAAAGYLTKPIKFIDFQTVVSRAIQRLEHETLLKSITTDSLNWITASFNRREYLFCEDSILYIEKEGKKTVIVYLQNGESHRLTSTLHEIQHQSTGCLFSPHRAYLVNIHHVLNIIPDTITTGNYVLVMRNEAVIPLTRRQYPIYKNLRDTLMLKC